MAKKQTNEAETMALIHYYGGRIASAHGGLCGVTRNDVVRWAERVAQLARTMPAKNSAYLSDD